MFLLINSSYGSRHHGGESVFGREGKIWRSCRAFSARFVAEIALHDSQCRHEGKPREYRTTSKLNKSPRAYFFSSSSFNTLLKIEIMKLVGSIGKIQFRSIRIYPISNCIGFQVVSVFKLFRFVASFARGGILNSRPGRSREVLVSVS